MMIFFVAVKSAVSRLPSPARKRSGGEGSGVGGLLGTEDTRGGNTPHPGAVAPTLPTARKYSRGEGKLRHPPALF